MNSLMLHAGSNNNWTPYVWFSEKGVEISRNERVVLRINDSLISAERYNDMTEEYEESEIKIVKSTIEHPVSYLIEWRGLELIGDFVNRIPNGVLIDNDSGVICDSAVLKGIPIEKWIFASYI